MESTGIFNHGGSYVRVACIVREIRIESLDGVEPAGDVVRLVANGGDLGISFPRELWERAVAEAEPAPEPAQDELSELDGIKRRLKEHAEENGFATVLEDVPCGDIEGGQRFDLVLRPGGMFAVTTGYVFMQAVLPEHVARYGVAMDEETFVEGAYLLGAVASDGALAAGDETLKVLSVRGRRCSSSRFELTTELWRVLSEGLGWRNVEPVAPGATRGRE
jgi:hypothetical protein